MKILTITVVLSVCLLHMAVLTEGQVNDQKEDYRQVVVKRAEKIVMNLGIADSLHFKWVRSLIANQYEHLNAIQSAHDARKKNAKSLAATDKTGYDKEINVIETETTRQLDSLHRVYIRYLGTELTTEQIEKVKDGMTYGVLPITYKGYQEMLPTLTSTQKANILMMLTEAREKAMDAGSSDEKHKWFGKYKGRINNYLSAQGYNMKKASQEWQARIKAEKSK